MDDRSREVDFDAFGPAVASPPAAHDPVAEAVAEHQRLFPEVVEEERGPRPRNVTPTPVPLAIVWGSRTGGGGHVVTIIGWAPDGPVLRCICEAGILGANPCWAMRATTSLIYHPEDR